MACTKCKTEEECGCKQEALHISQVCNPVVCDVEECSETFNAGCILYADEDIICNDVVLVTTGDTMAQALANVAAYFCTTEAVGDEILCGVDVVVPADTNLEDALPLVVAYFCNEIANLATFNSATVSFVDNQDIITGCKVRVYTITYYKGVDPGPYVAVDTVVFETPEICPQYNPCSSTSVPTPNPPGFIDSVLMCREGELGTEPVQIEWFDLLAVIPDTNTWDMAAVAFVSPVGDDFSGVVGDGNLPYGTVQQAAINSNMVIIKPGTYNEQIPLRDGVTYYFMPGSELTGNGYIYDTVSTGKVCRILGGLTITNTSTTGALEIDSDIDLHFEFDHITGVRQAMYIAGTARVRIYGRFISATGDANAYGMSFRDTTNVQVTLTEGYEANHNPLFFRGSGVGSYSGSCIFNSPYIKTLQANIGAAANVKATVAIDQFSSDAFIELNTNIINEAPVGATAYFGGLFIANVIEAPGGIGDRKGIYLNGNIVSNDHGLYTATEASFFDLYINGDIKSNTKSAIETQMRGTAGVTGNANIIIRGSKIVSGVANQLGSGRNYTFMDCSIYSDALNVFDYVEFGLPSATTAYFYNCIAEDNGTSEFIQGVPVAPALVTGLWNTVSPLALGANVVDAIGGYTVNANIVVPKI